MLKLKIITYGVFVLLIYACGAHIQKVSHLYIYKAMWVHLWNAHLQLCSSNMYSRKCVQKKLLESNSAAFA